MTALLMRSGFRRLAVWRLWEQHPDGLGIVDEVFACDPLDILRRHGPSALNELIDLPPPGPDGFRFS